MSLLSFVVPRVERAGRHWSHSTIYIVHNTSVQFQQLRRPKR
jgi:hypothetical protein